MRRTLCSVIVLMSIVAPRVNAQVDSAPGPLAPVIVFMFDIANGSQRIKDDILRDAGSDPVLLDIFKGALDKFRLETLAARLAAPLERSMPAPEIAQCSRFINSPASSALAKAADGVIDPDALISAYRSLPVEQKREVDLYFGSVCGKKLGEYLNSEQARSIGRAFGEDIVCQYATDTSQEMLAILQEHGKCSDIAAKG